MSVEKAEGEVCVTVRMFGSLHTLCRERGTDTTLCVDVPPEGVSARSLASSSGNANGLTK